MSCEMSCNTTAFTKNIYNLKNSYFCLKENLSLPLQITCLLRVLESHLHTTFSSPALQA